MPDLDTGYDEQDQSEVFDEDNTELESQRYGGRENEDVFEALPEVRDLTRAVGDDDDDEAEIGEELDDDELIALARDNDDDEDDLEDDDLRTRDEEPFAPAEDDGGYPDDIDDPDQVDRIARRERDEVELEYRGDLTDLAGAASAAQALESDTLSDSDLRELDYKDEFTVDEDEADAAAR